jgi:hypothetical protein
MTGIFAATVKTWVDKKINGNDPIFEKGHYLILSDHFHSQIVPIINALGRATNQPGAEFRKNAMIVVLTPLDRASAVKKLSEGVKEGMRVIVRSGDPLSITDLEKVCVADASKVLFLKSDQGSIPRAIAMQTSVLRSLRQHKASDGRPIAVLGTPGTFQLFQPLGYTLGPTVYKHSLISVLGADFKGQEQYLDNFAIVEEQVCLIHCLEARSARASPFHLT